MSLLRRLIPGLSRTGSPAEPALAANGLAKGPANPDGLFARAATLGASGRWREARDAALAAAKIQPPRADHCLQLGRICFQTGDLEGAATWFGKAAAADPGAIESCVNLAAALHAQNRLDEAIATYERALRLVPDHFDALIGLGNCWLDRGDAQAAATRFGQAIAVDDPRAIAWRFLGLALDRQDRESEALEAHARAAKLEADAGEDVGAFLGLAASLRDAGRFDESLALLEPNLSRGQAAEAQVLYAHMLLATGRLREGWHHNEFRWMTDHFLARRPGFVRPVWNGQDLRGKTILLRAEQGMGDAMQFARYAPMVKALGATVHLAVPPELAHLALGFNGVDRVFVLRQNESTSAFDFYIPLLSLPRVFGTDLDSIPAEVPYLRADPERVAHWAARLQSDTGVLKVGLAWGGNPMNAEDRFRSLPLQLLGPLGKVAGVRFYALQKGPREHEADAPPPGLDLVNLAPELADFADTAAAIAQMDLVISVCTSVAHLTGALGKPLWAMLHRAADWRWLVARDDSPWYPTARLFRQTQRGEWADVVDRIQEALEDRVRGGDPGIGTHVGTRAASPAQPTVTRPSAAPGYRPGFSAVAETRVGILEYVPDDGAAGDSVGWYGEWLQPQLDLLASMIRPGSTVIEVGAGIGAHAALLGAAVGEAGHLFAYEWRPQLRRILRQNLAANRVRPVTIMQRKPGRRRLPESGARDAAEEVATEALDDLRLERLDWLKINDGVAVLDVLQGAAESLWRLRPSLFVSVADAAMLDRVASALREFGYRCWRHEAALFSPQNFNRRENDLFAGRTALAVLAIAEEIQVDATGAGCVEWRDAGSGAGHPAHT